MPCLITKGIDKCGLVVGGLNRFYVANWQDLRGKIIRDANGIITDFSVTLPWLEFILVRNQAKYTGQAKDTAQGTQFIHQLDYYLPKMENDSYSLLNELIQGRLIVLFQDGNGTWFIFGLNQGAEVKDYDDKTGIRSGENGYNFEFLSNELSSLQEVSNDYFVDNIQVGIDICADEEPGNEGVELGNSTPLFQILDCIFFD